MAGKSDNTVENGTAKRRGQPPKSTPLTNVESGSTATPNVAAPRTVKPKRDAFKVYSLKLTDDVQAVVIRHGKEIEDVLLKSGNYPWKQLTDPNSIFYKMCARAVKSKSGGGKLVGVYYERSLALFPSNLVAQPIEAPEAITEE